MTLQTELLESWEATYKKGQLSLWIMLALEDGPKYLDEIQQFIHEESQRTISCENQSLYRALRKFSVVEMVEFSLHKGNKGPDRKCFELTPIGRDVLYQFTRRNIQPFFSEKLKTLMQIQTI